MRFAIDSLFRILGMSAGAAALLGFGGDACGGAVPTLGTRASVVPPKSGELLPPRSPLFLDPATNANLLVNSSFEMGKLAHRVFSETAYGPNAPRAVVSVVGDAAWHGDKSLKIVTPPDVRAILVGTSPRVGPSVKVVYSAWLKADRQTDVAFNAFAACYDVWRDGKAYWGGKAVSFPVTTSWRRFSASLVTEAGQAWVCPRLIFPSNAVFWVDAEQIEVSARDAPSAYKPAAAVEAAFDLDRSVFVQEPDTAVTRAARLVRFDYAARKATVETRAFATSRYGRFFLEADVAGRPALPAEYAVVHPLGKAPDRGLFIGANGGLPILRPGWNPQKNYVPDGEEEDFYRLFRLGGMKLLRLWDGGFQWMDLELEKGRYRWALLDHILDGTSAAGLDVMYVLGSTAFLKYKDRGQDRPYDGWFVRLNAKPAKKSGMPKWTSGLELKDADWDDFNRDLVRHAKGRIRYYETVNEPNLQVADADYYVRLMKLTYARVKAEDPSATVVGICSTGDFGGDLGGYIGEVGARGGFRYLDWMSFHPYNGATDLTAKTAERQLDEINGLVNRYRPGCPVIEDELYYICDRRTEHEGNLKLNWRASNVIRRYVLDFAGGCAASAPLGRDHLWHQGPEGTGINRSFFLCAHRHHPNDRYIASNAFAYFLEGGAFLRKPDVPEGLNGGVFRDARGSEVTVLWAKRASDARMLEVPKGVAAYDLFGNRIAGHRIRVTEDAVYLVRR